MDACQTETVLASDIERGDIIRDSNGFWFEVTDIVPIGPDLMFMGPGDQTRIEHHSDASVERRLEDNAG